MFDVATWRQLQRRWCTGKKSFTGKATSNIHKIDENFGMLQKKEHDEHIFLLMLGELFAGNDAQCTFTQNKGQTFLKIPLRFFFDEVRVKWFKICNH